MGSTLDRLARAENAIAQLSTHAQFLQGELADQKATVAQLGKMLLATTEQLVKKGHLDENGLMTKVTDLEDEQTKDHISQMVALKAIVSVDEVTEKSALIIRQVKEGLVISNYFLTPFKALPAEVAETILGAAPGFKFTHGLVESELLEIYNQAEG